MVSKFNSFCCVIEKVDRLNNKVLSELDLLKYLRSGDKFVFWSFILHDCDVNENGEKEREHYHLVLKVDSKYSCKTILNDIASELLINVNCISISGCRDFVKSVQYLIHKNDLEKVQYDIWNVYTNDTNDMFSIMFDSVSAYDVDIDYLIDLVHTESTLTSIYKKLGMKQVRLYRAIIMDLWKERFKS